jgi:hypothetical protein
MQEIEGQQKKMKGSVQLRTFWEVTATDRTKKQGEGMEWKGKGWEKKKAK